MISTTREKLEEIFYEADQDTLDMFYEIFSENAEAFNISTEMHENMFLAQIVAETGYDLKPKRENLNYTVESLKKTFSRYRNNPKWAEIDGRTANRKANQVAIGNVAYADRLGNGDIESGDGYLYRGGGYFQLTGKSNYRRMAEVIQMTTGSPIGPDNLAMAIDDVLGALLSAMAFWLDNECYECEDIDCVTRKINRYTDSYDKRKKIYQWIASLGK